MSSSVRPIVSGVLLVLTVLGLSNVYMDHSEVLELAKATACPTCDLRLEQLGKSPIQHTYHLRGKTSEFFVVECRRALIFVGSYSCTASGGASAAP